MGYNTLIDDVQRAIDRTSENIRDIRTGYVEDLQENIQNAEDSTDDIESELRYVADEVEELETYRDAMQAHGLEDEDDLDEIIEELDSLKKEREENAEKMAGYDQLREEHKNRGEELARLRNLIRPFIQGVVPILHKSGDVMIGDLLPVDHLLSNADADDES